MKITFVCYDRKTHSCDSRCLGKGDCPLAKGIKISRKEMWKYMKQRYIYQKRWDRFEQSMTSDWNFQQEVKKSLEKGF